MARPLRARTPWTFQLGEGRGKLTTNEMVGLLFDLKRVSTPPRGPRIASGGTFSANPASMVVGLAAMAALELPAFDRLERLGARLRARLGELHTNGLGCLSTPVTEREVEELTIALDRALAALAREA